MYSGSRGILYTAPPASDESNDDATEATASTADGDAATTAAEADDGLTADD
ncbi:hypothetical protein [Haloterrigena alkaliphila]|uniref:Uncharacterized protein n=1 Tax=Haloterrigena alkaliphila TaxID=2816475 RepID=A0A8A2VIP8_9EURY|nr:hypothetical protein [Haloterrigena alkaliphila]QSX00203.1 hypothetical protein J0X25_04355 [Haloterrigena alkaliphila]